MTETRTTSCLAEFSATQVGQALTIHNAQSINLWGWNAPEQQLQFEGGASPTLAATVAAVGTALGQLKAAKVPRLRVQAPGGVLRQLLEQGVGLADGERAVEISAELFWQYAPAWLERPLAALPLRYDISNGRRHPLRRPQPEGVVYRRRIDWLGQTLSFRVADSDVDLPHFHRWMNDPHVAEFWEEEGSLEQHRAYLDKVAADGHSVPLIACLDDVPFGYFETYWAKEDRIAPFYDVDDYDRGWHVLIGEPVFRGKPFVSAWLPSISHYLFLDDCRTRRLVIEPRADNGRMRRNLARSGYALVKEFDFPHKRAVLGSLLRERFFAEQLWLPQTA